MAIYIHIPFCNTICNYCDFCKVYYKKDLVDKYLGVLKTEIEKNYKNEEVKTIYIGGGTPSSLSIKQLRTLFKILKIFKITKDLEFTIECNVESLTKEKIDLFKRNKVNRISIGVQTFESKFDLLNRYTNYNKLEEIIDYLNLKGIDNISLDLIYGFDESIKSINQDLKKILELNIKHISYYSLSINENTVFYINKKKNIDEDIDYKMYNLIRKKLKKKKFIQYEISNFSKKGYESKHNLTYWNNEQYYGFGLSASGYIGNYRYSNTKNLNKYLDNNYLEEKEMVLDKMTYEFILGFRKIEGINKKKFFEKYNMSINNITTINKLLDSKKLIENKTNIYVSNKWIYKLNEILIEFIV